MKTFLLTFLITVLMFAVSETKAQQTAKLVYTNSAGTPVLVKDGVNALPVKQEGSFNLYTLNDTSKITVTTVTPGFVINHIKIWFNGATTDTLYFSPVATFPPGQTIKRIGGKDLDKYFACSTFYIKVGYTPVTGKAFQVELE